jgi:hypothetical protein
MKTWSLSPILGLALLTHFLCLPVPAAEPDPAPEGSFSIVVIPDTQRYLGRGTKIEPESENPVSNQVFENHTRWIVDNIERQRIVFVSHVGDIVDKNNHDQWRIARKCMDRLHGKIPYGISVGNHDMTGQGNSSLFQEYFGAERYSQFDWYGGTFAGDPDRQHTSNNNANSDQLISAEGLDFVILHLECNAPDNVLEWADSVLERHADRRAIVTTHMDLGPIEKPKVADGYRTDPKGRMRWVKIHGPRGNSPAEMWEKCFRKHANLFLICSGDQSRTTALTLTSKGDHGNTVHALLSDYTSNGPLRIYRFLPEENRIQVITFDTTRRELVTAHPNVPGGRESHQFSIPYAMSRE